VGTLLVVATCGWGWWRLRGARDLVSHLLLGAFTIHAFFALGVGVHEHHMMLAVPVLGLAAALEPHLRRLWIGISLVCALNMNLFYGISMAGMGVPARHAHRRQRRAGDHNLALLARHARPSRAAPEDNHHGSNGIVDITSTIDLEEVDNASTGTKKSVSATTSRRSVQACRKHPRTHR
jgi:hypothetical protein